jgi:hypothetical protein
MGFLAKFLNFHFKFKNFLLQWECLNESLPSEKAKEMQIVKGNYVDLVNWHNLVLNTPKSINCSINIIDAIINFGGDRLTITRDGGVFFAKEDDEVIGLVSYSPTGEYNKSGIVGIWVKKDYTETAKLLIDHVIMTLYKGELLSFDAISKEEYNYFTEEQKQYFSIMCYFEQLEKINKELNERRTTIS